MSYMVGSLKCPHYPSNQCTRQPLNLFLALFAEALVVDVNLLPGPNVLVDVCHTEADGLVATSACHDVVLALRIVGVLTDDALTGEDGSHD
jgi:hypothetical protein